MTSVALIVSPGFFELINPMILLPIGLGEPTLALWLPVKGFTIEAK